MGYPNFLGFLVTSPIQISQTSTIPIHLSICNWFWKVRVVGGWAYPLGKKTWGKGVQGLSENRPFEYTTITTSTTQNHLQNHCMKHSSTFYLTTNSPLGNLVFWPLVNKGPCPPPVTIQLSGPWLLWWYFEPAAWDAQHIHLTSHWFPWKLCVDKAFGASILVIQESSSGTWVTWLLWQQTNGGIHLRKQTWNPLE